VKIAENRRCAGPDCGNERRGKLAWCRRCVEVPVELQTRWTKALAALARAQVVPDAIWDEYLDARASFIKAR
jgi:hypothetical protein